MNLESLKQCSQQELEDTYCQSGPVVAPTGCFDGTCLMRLDQPGDRRPGYLVTKSFELVPFGVNFDACLWYFFHPFLGVGRFRADIGSSRWRDSTVVSLHYDVSRLPNVIRNVLYDEVKPLTDDLCLGIGGLNQGRGIGDHFFFALTRRK